MQCEYGCNQEAKFQLKNGKWCCAHKQHNCPAIKQKNSDGLKKAYLEGRKKLNPKFDQYRNWSKGLTALNSNKIHTKCKKDEIFIENSKSTQHYVKKILMQEENFVHKCQICENTEWMGKPITLELDHINGQTKDNRKENLRFICPNCHSMTHTWKKRNAKNLSKKIVSDEELIEAIKKEPNIRKALESVGLTGKGRNYKRCYELLVELSIDNEEFKSKIRAKPKTVDIDEKLLLSLLSTNSLKSISEKLNCSEYTIRYFCKKHNILIPTIEQRHQNHLL